MIAQPYDNAKIHHVVHIQWVNYISMKLLFKKYL